MTLISGFMKDECPILIGDLLLSNVTDSNNELVIPTLAKISSNDFKKGIYKPSGLTQKLNLLSPKLALAWSGSWMDAKEFMGEVMGVVNHNNLSRELILDIYKDLSPKDLSVIGLLKDRNGMMLFEKNTTNVNIQDRSFAWFRASGSGYDSLSNFLPENYFDSKKGQLNRLQSGLVSAIRISTSLLSLEIKTSSPINNLFGAGYEIVHPLGDKLVKFEDVTYNFWEANEFEHGKWSLSSLSLIMKYSYHNDILVIRCCRPLLNIDKKAFIVEKDELHFIEPIYRIINQSEYDSFVPSSFNSKWVANVFLCTNINGIFRTFNSFSYSPNQSAHIVFINEFQKNESIEISTAFIQDSIKKIMNNFQSIL